MQSKMCPIMLQTITLDVGDARVKIYGKNYIWNRKYRLTDHEI